MRDLLNSGQRLDSQYSGKVPWDQIKFALTKVIVGVYDTKHLGWLQPLLEYNAMSGQADLVLEIYEPLCLKDLLDALKEDAASLAGVTQLSARNMTTEKHAQWFKEIVETFSTREDLRPKMDCWVSPNSDESMVWKEVEELLQPDTTTTTTMPDQQPYVVAETPHERLA